MPKEQGRSLEEQELRSRTPRGRLFELDALRGLAAFTVLWHHLRLALPGGGKHAWYLALITGGHQAVRLFFVLSGYVLSMPYWRGKQMPYGRYLVRRFFRIYVPFFVGFLLAWVGAWKFYGSQLPLTAWFHLTWQTPLTWKLFLQQAFMSSTAEINTAFWSLRVEAEFSILLPFFCFVVLRLPWMLTLLVGLLSYAASLHFQNLDAVNGLSAIPMFLFGMLLSRHAQWIETTWSRLPSLVTCLVPVVALLLYLRFLPAGNYADYLTGIGSSLLIVASLHMAPLSNLLRHAIPEYLGRISYSLYLVHATILFATLNLLYGRISLWLLGSIYCVVALACAHLLCVLVEEPAMRYGKRLTSPRTA